MTPAELDALVARAIDGDRASIEQLVLALQRRIYNLALRMLWHPEDAQDATQEILLKIIVHLGTFRGEAAVTTWAMRIAANHLLHVKRSRIEKQELTFGSFADDLRNGLSEPAAPAVDDPEQQLLEDEVKIGCTHAMLSCLDRPHRLAYVIGEVFELHHEEAAAILDISPAAYRQRLSRARGRIRDFMSQHCGLVSSEAACRCRRRIRAAVEAGRVDPHHLLFARTRRDELLQQHTEEMDELHRIAGILRSHPDYAAPTGIADAIRSLLGSERFRILG